MRITQNMMIGLVSRNLSQNLTRLMELQSQMSSARRIQKPSDDAMGVTRDLSYRAQLADIDQYKRNISWGKSWLGMVEQTLGGVANSVQQAKEIATALSNDTYDANARRSAAREVESIFDRLLAAANSKIEDRYIFSGHRTRTEAFRASSSGVVYMGDQGRTRIQIAAGAPVQVNQTGSDVMLTPLAVLGETFDLNPGVTRARLLTELNAGSGVDLGAPGNGQFTITDNNTGDAVTVDISAETTVGAVIDAINAGLAAGGITNLTASVSPVGNAIRLTPTPGGTITAQTPIRNLNNGTGVQLLPGTFRVRNESETIDIPIDLTGAETVEDIITAFNTQIAAGGVAGVTMSINPAGTGLQITDTNIPPLGLWVEDLNQQSTARDLGLVGYVDDQLDGADLNPRSDFTVSESVPGGAVAAQLGLLGSFKAAFDGADLDPILSLATPVADMNNNLGLSLGRVRIAQGDVVRTIDLASAATIGDVINALNTGGVSISASINAGRTGIQVEPTVNDRTLMITNDDSSGSAKALGIYGSPDVFGNLLLLVQALDNNDRDLVGAMIGSLENAANRLLEQRASVGAKVIRLETTDDRLTELNLSLTRLLSEVEDADILKVTTDLAAQQNVYQAALNSAARMLTPSLIDFMR